MKRKAVWLVVPVALGLVAYGAKYRLDHPPLSQGDKLFRQLVERADEVKIEWNGVLIAPNEKWVNNPVLGGLRDSRVQELKDVVRLVDAPIAGDTIRDYELKFYCQKKYLGSVGIGLSSYNYVGLPGLNNSYPLHTRFAPRLRAYLAWVAPRSGYKLAPAELCWGYKLTPVKPVL